MTSFVSLLSFLFSAGMFSPPKMLQISKYDWKSPYANGNIQMRPEISKETTENLQIGHTISKKDRKSPNRTQKLHKNATVKLLKTFRTAPIQTRDPDQLTFQVPDRPRPAMTIPVFF